MKILACLVLVLSFNAAQAGDSKAKGAHCDDKAAMEAPQAQEVSKKMPRMPASDGSCAPGDVFNPTDGTCIAAPSAPAQ